MRHISHDVAGACHQTNPDKGQAWDGFRHADLPEDSMGW